MSDLPHLKSAPLTEQAWFQALMDLARYLRTPEGCPWDREQSSRSFASYVEGEARELMEAFDTDDAHLAEEFGDCLFTLLASVAAAEEEGRFTLETVLSRAHEKMIRRHAHVFGEQKAATAEDAIAAWNRVKALEKQGGEGA